MKLAADANGKLNPFSGQHVRRFCDNPQCRNPLTHELQHLKGKFGMQRRIAPGVVTLAFTVRQKDGTDKRASGEWCGACANAGMAVLLDKLMTDAV